MNDNIDFQLISKYEEQFPTNDFFSIKDEVIDISKRQLFNDIEFIGGNDNTENVGEDIGANEVNGINTNVNSANANTSFGAKTLIPNPDCHNISDVLNDFGLDYGWKETNDCCMFNRIVCLNGFGEKTTKTTSDTTITELFFNNIKLNGSIPTSICSLINLKTLQFVNNTGLNGNIPPCIGGMNKLEKLVFSNTPVSGEIPKSISVISTLKYLSIEKTNIQSSIPEEITKLTNLVKLYINNNPYVTGTIPKGITNLKNLEMISFSDSNIGGNIPEDIGSLTALKTLSIHHTIIEGKIPDSIGQLSNLQTVKFHDTKLTGKLPDSFKNLKSLKVLTLNNTSIEGALPDELKSNTFEVCSFDKTKLCLSSEAIKNDSSTPACMTSLPVCSASGGAGAGGGSKKEDDGGLSILSYTLMFFAVVFLIGTVYFFYRRYKSKVTFQQEKRGINYFKNNVSEQPKWIENNLFNTPIIHNNNIQAYNCNVEQSVDPSVFTKDSFMNRFFDGMHLNQNNNYQKLNDSQYPNGNMNNTYMMPSDNVFQYNAMGMDDGMKQMKMINEDGSLRNMDDTFVNRNKNEYNFEYDNMNKSISQKSLDSEKTEIEANRAYENMNSVRIPYNDSLYKMNSSSGSSSIPLPPNSDNMVFMGREAQEELMLFQQKNNLSFNDEETKSVKEQLQELEQMANNNYNTARKSPKNPTKSPRSFKSPSSFKSPKSPSSSQNANRNDYNMNNINNSSKSIDINDQILELKYCSFNGLDLNADNFHNSQTFDKIEKRFLNNLNSLRPDEKDDKDNNLKANESVDTVEDDDNDNNKTKESKMFTFSNIPGLQIQQYYNQLNFSVDETKTTTSGWGGPAKEEKKFDKIIPSGIFTTNKTSWDTTEDESFFSEELSKSRDTRNDYTNTTSMNTSSLNKEIKSKLGTDSMMITGKNYKSDESSDDDGYSKYKSGVTDDSRYKSGVSTDDGYSRYKSGVTEDSRYRSGVSTDDDYSKYNNSEYTDKYKSGYTTDDGYSRYKSGLTADDDGYGYSKYSEDQSKLKTISVDASALDSMNTGFPDLIVTGPDDKKLSTDTKKTDSTRYTSTTADTADTITKDYTLSTTGYSSTGGYTLSNATLSSGFTISSSIKTNSNGSSLAPPKTNSSRTTKTSSNLNIVSTLSSSGFSAPNTDSLFSDFSKYSSLNSMETISSVSSLSFSDLDDKKK